MSTAIAESAPAPSPDETIRRTVRALRSAYNVDARVLAQHLGISRNSLYNRLNGAAPWLAAEIVALATFFAVPITDFYEGTVRVGRHAESADTGTYTPRFPRPTHRSRPPLSLVPELPASNRAVADRNGSSPPAATYGEDPIDDRSAGSVNNAHAA